MPARNLAAEIGFHALFAVVTNERCLRQKQSRADRESNFYLFAFGIIIGIAIENGVDKVKADTDTDTDSEM